MFTISSLLILFILTFKFLSSYIKTIRTGDPNETNLTYWMFSYDFKSQNKEWVPEDKKLLQRNAIYESLVSFKRAGANAIVSYYADRIDKILD